MRGDAALGDRVHVLGADLHFDRRAERAEQHGVQRLVAVRLGNRDEVAETPVERLVQAMHRTERLIAMRDGIDDDAQAVHVHHLRQRFCSVRIFV
jgi:hypothetical protein